MIQPITRKVEQTNPRMEIRRDESEHYGGRKKGGGEDAASSIPWEDTTVVSVAGLRSFLQSLLGGASSSGTTETLAESELEPPKQEFHEPANTYVSRATHAYQSTGKAVHDRNVGEPPPITTGANAVTLGADFGEEELNRIGEYIDRLANLEQSGIPEITLRRTLGFLDAIGQGIDDALSV
ncbi:MAG TPA: hypothetical protein PKI93_00400 [Alphaproteobacteria bacterium]|nr:hypothetical protein [Alphaproteobacteria bacterium]HNS43788.1 hypothetical protein [Alphaproteobacteria bacterium]